MKEKNPTPAPPQLPKDGVGVAKPGWMLGKGLAPAHMKRLPELFGFARR